MSAGCEPTSPYPNVGPNGAEFEANIELVPHLHRYHENATGIDEHNVRSVADLATELAVDGPVPPVDPKRYILPGTETVTVDTPEGMISEYYDYGEMEWTPGEGTLTAGVTDRILVRYPLMRGRTFSGKRKINDMIIVINGDSYLLNDDGVTPFADGESLVLDREKLESAQEDGELPNVLSVRGEYHWAAAPLTAVDLRRMLLQESTYSQRENPQA